MDDDAGDVGEDGCGPEPLRGKRRQYEDAGADDVVEDRRRELTDAECSDELGVHTSRSW